MARLRVKIDDVEFEVHGASDAISQEFRKFLEALKPRPGKGARGLVLSRGDWQLVAIGLRVAANRSQRQDLQPAYRRLAKLADVTARGGGYEQGYSDGGGI